MQFQDTELEELPRMYLATPNEIAEQLKKSAAGRGETILYENHCWGSRAFVKGTADKIPEEWRFTKERIEIILDISKD